MSKEDELDKFPRKVVEVEKELDDIKEELEVIEKEYGGEIKIQKEDVFQEIAKEVTENLTRSEKSSKEIQKVADKSPAKTPKKAKKKTRQNDKKKSKGRQNREKGDGLQDRKFSLDSDDLDINIKTKAEGSEAQKNTKNKDSTKKEKIKKKQTKKPVEKKTSSKKDIPKKKTRSTTGRTKFSSKLNIGVLRFPGTNNEYETVKALKSFGVAVEIVHTFEPEKIKSLDGIWIAGGLSYADSLRGSVIASVSAFMDEIIKEDKPILGVSDGFRILTELKLLPGSLKSNNSTKFICDWIYITIPENNSYLADLKGSKLKLPIAHLEGNLYAENVKDLKSNAIAYYSNYRGYIQEKYNPNGSTGNVAGLGSKSIAALMPHPERAAFKFQGSMDGRRIIEAFLHEVKR